MKIRFVIATRVSESDFFSQTASGRSLSLHLSDELEIRLFPENTLGLSAVYNQAIREAVSNPAILVFAHDDIHFLDFFLPNRIKEGLQQFQVIGLAGNRRRVANQPSWAFIDNQFTWDSKANLSGIVAHGNDFPPKNLSNFGPSRQRVVLLDGLLFASHSETLIQNQLFFDEQFKFHFYDLDFCRLAESKSIICGTWDLSVIHNSGGNFGSLEWLQSYKTYLSKWRS